MKCNVVASVTIEITRDTVVGPRNSFTCVAVSLHGEEEPVEVDPNVARPSSDSTSLS